MTRFRAIWPITNERLPFTALVAQAQHDLPFLAAQAHARITGPGRWSAALSTDIPGSGRVTKWVLLYEAPATHRTRTTSQTIHQEAGTAA
ncbi:hypothetical protein [Nocardioides sp. SYSU D00065]|uniref:hypothetical protein n=1 Tax=Nocardioides sp. SYSU D00065 TaxID=2817378 RepID=UPI001B344C51|nr:hypothetical protein [Nocardioides sp. SYSU D00065]